MTTTEAQVLVSLMNRWQVQGIEDAIVTLHAILVTFRYNPKVDSDGKWSI